MGEKRATEMLLAAAAAAAVTRKISLILVI